MINRLTKKLKEEKQTYNFRTSGFAGLCPDCGRIIEFRSCFQEFNCTGKDCAFRANINGERVFDNKKREENLKKTIAEVERQSRIENEVLKYYGIIK